MRLLLSALLLLSACGGTAPSPVASDAHRQVDVLIAGDGYAPDKVEARPGEDITLVFERLDENNCGGEIVFPATGERHTVPVGKKVPVSVKVPPSGTLAFTCGMGMYEGAVVVQGS